MTTIAEIADDVKEMKGKIDQIYEILIVSENNIRDRVKVLEAWKKFYTKISWSVISINLGLVFAAIWSYFG